MESTPRIFELKAALFFLILLLLLLGTYSDRKLRENKDLNQQMELLKTDIEDLRNRNQGKLDSLQQLIGEREQAHLQLKDSLQQLERERHLNTQRSNEKKIAIGRIADVDSLYREVAGHYR